MVDFECGSCGDVFTRARNQTHLVKWTKSTYCSRSCWSKHLSPSIVLKEYKSFQW